MPIVHALERKFRSVGFVANRKFADLGADPTFALDDLDLAPFFAKNSELSPRWSDYFRKQELVLSYLSDPAGIFEQNVRACGVRRFVAGPYRFEEGVHAIEQLARPLVQLGIALEDFAPRLDLNATEQETREFGKQIIALHPGSGSARKNWPIENWMALIEGLVPTTTVVIIGGEADEREIAHIRERFAGGVHYAVNWPLRKLAALLSGVRFIGHDSGISHLAAAVGAHCMILYGPTNPEIWAPRNQNACVLVAPGRDLRRLDVGRVRAAISPGSC